MSIKTNQIILNPLLTLIRTIDLFSEILKHFNVKELILFITLDESFLKLFIENINIITGNIYPSIFTLDKLNDIQFENQNNITVLTNFVITFDNYYDWEKIEESPEISSYQNILDQLPDMENDNLEKFLKKRLELCTKEKSKKILDEK